jgi:hypothetical protein
MRPNLGPKARYHYSESAELEHRELLLSLFGEASPRQAARVGRLAHDLARCINAQTEIVVVSAITIMKVKGKHAEILYSDLDLLQHGFNTGRVQKDGARHLIFLFRDPRHTGDKPRTLKAIVKSAHRGAELILSSYHMCTGKRLTAALKKGDLIRDW